jgi:hypothetical protein
MRIRIAGAGLCLFALASGSALGSGTKLPKTLTTPTGNFITLYAVSTALGHASLDVKVCTSAHTPLGTMVMPSLYSLRLSTGSSLQPGTAVRSPALGMTPLGPRQCARGWLSFDVPKGATPTALVYTFGKPIVWNLGEPAPR